MNDLDPLILDKFEISLSRPIHSQVRHKRGCQKS